MVLGLILIGVILLGVLMITILNYNDWISGFGFIFIVVAGLWLVVHIGCIATRSYKYEMFVHKKVAFEMTLKSARENGNIIESAAVINSIAEWNVELAEKQYNATTFLFKDYEDVRVLTLKPIQ